MLLFVLNVVSFEMEEPRYYTCNLSKSISSVLPRVEDGDT